MIIEISYMGQPRAYGSSQPDGTIDWQGPRVTSVQPLVRSMEARGLAGDDLLRALCERYTGRWLAVPVDTIPEEAPPGLEPAGVGRIGDTPATAPAAGAVLSEGVPPASGTATEPEDAASTSPLTDSKALDDGT